MLINRFDDEKAIVKKDSKGIYKIDFTAMKTGVYPYYDWYEDKVFMELKHPDDFVQKDIVDQMQYLPITDQHPYELLTGDNKAQYTKGIVLEGSIGTDSINGSGIVYDSTLIGKIVTDEQVECSLGFVCELVEEEGEYNGVKYDRKQINPNLNHMAIVEMGRCGKEASIHKDSINKYAVRVDSNFIKPEKVIQNTNVIKEEKAMKKIKIDSVEMEVDEIVASRLDSLQGQVDGLTMKLSEVKTDEQIDTIVSKRVQEILDSFDDAKDFLPDDYSIVGKSARDIKVDAIKSLDVSFDSKEKSDDYITGRFDSMKAPKVVDASRNDSVAVEVTDEKEQMMQARLNMHKGV